MRRVVRTVAWLTIAAQIVFVAAWIAAGALQRHYSAFHSAVSSLAAHGMRDPGIEIAAFALMGASLAALGFALRAVLPARPATNLATLAFALAGIGFLVAAATRLDCDVSQAACKARLDAGQLSWQTDAHLWAALVAELALLVTPFAIGRALWPRPSGALALAAAAAGIDIAIAATIAYGAGAPDGIVERLQLAAANLWAIFVACGLLYETRPAPRLAAPARLRPRDFFGSAWAGEGVALGVPALLWRRFGPRFKLTRETTWHSDEVAVVRDRAYFANGDVDERVRFARFVDPQHVHITADDMPDGADVTIDESGYRVAPYRALAAVGPVRFILRARDAATVEADGTLRYVTRLRWHGLPVATLEMRARPVDTWEGWPHAATPSRPHAAGSRLPHAAA